MSVDEGAASRVYNNLKQNLLLCEEEGEELPASFIELIELSRAIVEMKNDNAKLVNQFINLKTELQDMQSVGQLTCVGGIGSHKDVRGPIEGRRREVCEDGRRDASG